MFRTLIRCAALTLCLLSLAARADVDDGSGAASPAPPLVSAAPPPVVAPGDHWGVVSATTNAPGHDVFSVEVGFPGVSFGYSHAMSDTSDWGIKLDVLYGFLYTTNTQFGVAARLPLRWVVAQRDRFSVLVHVDPGLFTYAGSENLFGLIVPVGAAIGFQPINDLRLSFGVDLPLAVQFLHSADFFVGPQFGFAVEMYVDKHVSVVMNLRFGPMFVPTETSDAQLGFVAQATLGYRL